MVDLRNLHVFTHSSGFIVKTSLVLVTALCPGTTFVDVYCV